MKYKEVSKMSPVAGRFTDLTVTHVSAVDSPANKQTFLQIKGEKKKSMLTEIQKNEMRVMGMSEAEIAKEDTGDGVLIKVAKFFGIGNQSPTPEPAKPEALTADIIAKAVQDGIQKGLAEIKKTAEQIATPEAPTTEITPEQKLANVEAEIQKEKDVVAKQSDIEKKLAEKTAELEEVRKMRTGGNSSYQANYQQAPLDQETIAKAEFCKIFEGSALA